MYFVPTFVPTKFVTYLYLAVCDFGVGLVLGTGMIVKSIETAVFTAVFLFYVFLFLVSGTEDYKRCLM